MPRFSIIRRRGVFLCLLACMLFFLTLPVHAAEASGVDVILLIDTSGSMRYSDSSGTALESARMFIDLMEANHSRVGVISFTDVLKSIIPLTPVETPSDKDEIKKVISRFTNYGYTDIGLAVMEAARMITADPVDGNSPMILLLTDGIIEVSPTKKERTVADSYNDLQEAIKLLDGKVPVYTIGLDQQKSVDAALLKSIADSTSARTYIADYASELPQIFNEIFADHVHSLLTEAASFTADGSHFTDVAITVNNRFTSEINAIVLSSRRLYDMRLKDPAGKVVAFDEVNYIRSQSNQYSLVKIVNPDEGDWILQIKGTYNDPVKVNILSRYKVDLSLAITQDGQSNGDDSPFDAARPFTVTAGLTQAEAYDGTQAELRVYDSGMTLLATIPMDMANGAFTAEYQAADANEINIAVQVANGDFEKNSGLYKVTFAAVEETPAPTVEPLEPTVLPTTTDQPETSPQPTSTAEAAAATASPDKSPLPYNKLLLIGAAAVLLMTIVAIFLQKLWSGSRNFKGGFELRAISADGVYSQREFIALNDFSGRLTLIDCVSANLNGQAARTLLTPADLDGISIAPGQHDKKPVIQLINKSNCEITDDENNILTQKKIVWQSNRRLSFANADAEDLSSLEIVYHASENAKKQRTKR